MAWYHQRPSCRPFSFERKQKKMHSSKPTPWHNALKVFWFVYTDGLNATQNGQRLSRVSRPAGFESMLQITLQLNLPMRYMLYWALKKTVQESSFLAEFLRARSSVSDCSKWILRSDKIHQHSWQQTLDQFIFSHYAKIVVEIFSLHIILLSTRIAVLGTGVGKLSTWATVFSAFSTILGKTKAKPIKAILLRGYTSSIITAHPPGPHR